MRSAVVLALASIMVLIFLLVSGQATKSSGEQPQTSPPPHLKPAFTEDYEEAMSEKDRKVLLVFGAEWCPHCVTLKAHLKDVNLDGFLVCVLDVDKRKEMKSKHSLKALPTCIIVDKGEEVSRMRGFDKKKFDAWIEENR